ncbi:hypothetical protein CFIO01_02145 [Colletotrichum fioriniae PJ7]|uniref:Uncharacterized protein n=1 Tax=Colletotrichum fioriniae PJ7 TaxID=1445577 RepID=A0A010QXM0_9PEZI|nr:hypothetical protein CFIO01_02145 [Colletotrichum fioriniae PJ7]
MDQKVRAKTRGRKLSNTLESKERRAWPKPQCPWMMPRRHSSFQTADATDFSEQVPHGSSSIKVAFVIMRNLWAQVLESRGIYLCLGAGWSTTQVWPLRRDWGGSTEKGNDTTNYGTWNRPGAVLAHWSVSGTLVRAPLRVSVPLMALGLFVPCPFLLHSPGKRKDWTHTGQRQSCCSRERERESERGSWQQSTSKGE